MKLIMFDYDGVIMDSFFPTKKIYLDISKEFNLNLPDKHEYFKELLELDWRETLKKLNIVTKEDIEKEERIFMEGLEKYKDFIRPYYGIPDVLDLLSKRYVLAVATNNFRKEVESKLK